MAREITTADITRQYAAAMDSVRLINEIIASGDTDSETVGVLADNRDHLKLMLAKDFWTTEDLQPLRDAAGS
jgi:hypothetical protein